MQEKLFVVGAPVGMEGDVEYALKVVGSPRLVQPRVVQPRAQSRVVGSRPNPRTVGFCTQIQTPQGNVMLAPFVPSSYPENWLNMLAYDRCSSPDEFPYRQTSPCDCGCGKPQCTGCGCQNTAPPATPQNKGYYGEHHLNEAEPIMAAGYQSRPRCTSGAMTVVSGVPAPASMPLPAVFQTGPTVGNCPGPRTASTPLPLQMIPGYPIPKRVVSVPRYAPVPAATSCGCDAAASPEAAGSVTPPAAFYLYNPYGTIAGRRPW